MWHRNLPMNSTEGHLDTVQQLRCLRPAGKRVTTGVSSNMWESNRIAAWKHMDWFYYTQKFEKIKTQHMQNLLSNETSRQDDSTYYTNATAFQVQSHHKSQRLTFWTLQGGAIRVYGRYVDIARWVYFHSRSMNIHCICTQYIYIYILTDWNLECAFGSITPHVQNLKIAFYQHFGT